MVQYGVRCLRAAVGRGVREGAGWLCVSRVVVDVLLCCRWCCVVVVVFGTVFCVSGSCGLSSVSSLGLVVCPPSWVASFPSLFFVGRLPSPIPFLVVVAIPLSLVVVLGAVAAFSPLP